MLGALGGVKMKDRMPALPLPIPLKSLRAAQSPRAIDIVNRHVTMARARAVRVVNESLTVVYARENKTKGRVKFDMDTAFDDVCEGDVGILIIVETEIHGNDPFYRFVRDSDIPTIDDVIKLGTGDVLTDDIYKALKEKGKEAEAMA